MEEKGGWRSTTTKRPQVNIRVSGRVVTKGTNYMALDRYSVTDRCKDKGGLVTCLVTGLVTVPGGRGRGRGVIQILYTLLLHQPHAPQLTYTSSRILEAPVVP